MNIFKKIWAKIKEILGINEAPPAAPAPAPEWTGNYTGMGGTASLKTDPPAKVNVETKPDTSSGIVNAALLGAVAGSMLTSASSSEPPAPSPSPSASPSYDSGSCSSSDYGSSSFDSGGSFDF